MKDLIEVEKLSPKDKALCGGKAWNLKRLGELGFKTPKTAVLLTRHYDKFVNDTGIRGMIFREIGRKEFTQMRWEELWDMSLRIKSLFLKSEFSKNDSREIKDFIDSFFKKHPLAARSSAPGEDGKMSFAGLHESYVT
jgi:pyruvate,water dikinase